MMRHQRVLFEFKTSLKRRYFFLRVISFDREKNSKNLGVLNLLS
jgi:hypothetical protein